MEKPCYKCGEPVEEGTPFCPHCGAPLIRVITPEAQPEIQPPPARWDRQPYPEPQHGPIIGERRANTINWREGLVPIIAAGVITGFASWIPFGVIWVIAGGGLAVSLYRRRSRTLAPIGAGLGAKIGAMAGIVAYFVFCVIAFFALRVYGNEFWAAVTQNIRERAGAHPDANVQKAIETLNTAEGRTALIIFALIFMFVLFVALTSLGGALSAAMNRRRRPI